MLLTKNVANHRVRRFIITLNMFKHCLNKQVETIRLFIVCK